MKRLTLFLILSFGVPCAWAQEAADTAAYAAAVGEEPAAEAASPEQLWDRANTAYVNGDYHAAAEIYEGILAQGLSSVKLYYNLANAYFKEGQLGKSILFYRRALRLAPGSDDIRYNLSVAEARTKDNIEQIPEFFLTEWMRGVRHTMSCTAWSILSLAALVCALALFLTTCWHSVCRCARRGSTERSSRRRRSCSRAGSPWASGARCWTTRRPW